MNLPWVKSVVVQTVTAMRIRRLFRANYDDVHSEHGVWRSVLPLEKAQRKILTRRKTGMVTDTMTGTVLGSRMHASIRR